MKLTRPKFAALAIGLMVLTAILNVFVISGISHDRSQRILYSEFRNALKNGTAPVDTPVESGRGVAILKIDKIDVDEVVVEGTSSRNLQRGVGHLRSSSLPGQYGTSVIIGRRTTYGGTFGKIGSLDVGDEIEIISAQGTTTYLVASKDTFSGEDAAAFAPAGNALRLVTSASMFDTGKRLSVLAVAKKGTTFPIGAKATITPVSIDELGANFNHQNAGGLLVWLQILLLAILGAVWLTNRWGFRESWKFVAPVLTMLGFIVCNQAIGVMPAFF